MRRRRGGGRHRLITAIGHEDAETRRAPWVTLSLIALCSVAWIATLYVRASAEILPPEHYQAQAIVFWEDHPYLEIDEALAFFMLEKDRPELFTAAVRGAEQGGGTQRVLAGDFSERDWERWFKSKRLRASFSADGQRPGERAGLDVELARLTRRGFDLSPENVRPEGGYPAHRFGLTPADPTWYGFGSHMFLHASWAHILGSLFLFFLVAPALENRWGRSLFAGFYLTAGIFSAGFYTALSTALSSGTQLPLVGASGAIAAVVGSFLVLYWKTKIKSVCGLVLQPLLGTFQLAAWVVLPLWLVNEMLGGFATDAVGIRGGTAYWAHIGGLLFGSGFALCVRRFQLEERYLHTAIARKRTRAQGENMVEDGRLALQQGKLEEAFSVFQRAASDRPEDLDSVLGLWQVSVASGKAEKGATPLLAWIRLAVAEERGKHAGDVWCQAIEIEPRFPVDGPTLLKLVPIFAELDRRESAVLALRYVLSNSNPSLKGAMALRARQLAVGLDAPTELLALQRILALADLPVDKEERIWARVIELETDGVAASLDPLASGDDTAEMSHSKTPPAGMERPPATPQPRAAQVASQPSPDAAETHDPFGLTDGRAIEIDLEDDRPPVVPQAKMPDLPPPVDETDMSYFGENSMDTEPLGLADSFHAPATALQPLVAPGVGEAPAAPTSRDQDIELGGAAVVARFSSAQRSEVVPVKLEDDHLVLQTGKDNFSRLELRRIQGIACAVVEDVSAKPVLVIDLLLNWRDASAEVLHVVRLRSNTFDPSALMPNSSAGVEALRGVLDRIRDGSGADALPSPAAFAGQPFARFGRLVDYERDVLLVGTG